MEEIIAYIDGSSKGNPGLAGIGLYIPQLNKKYSKSLGTKTNNEAEYEAAIFALKKLKQLLGKKRAKKTKIALFTDSELLFSQVNHHYKIKEKNLIPLFIELWNLMIDFGKVEIKRIPREQNTIADKLAKQGADFQD